MESDIMTKTEYYEMGARYAREHWAAGRGFYCVSATTGWRDAAYRAGYADAWSKLEK